MTTLGGSILKPNRHGHGDTTHTRKFLAGRWPIQIALMLCSILLLAPFASAQYRASIQGVVTDAQGALIPGATVTLQDLATNLTQTTESNAEGVYNFYALPPSSFKLTVSRTGFETKVIDNLTLIPEQVNSVNVELQVGQAVESVTVNAVTVPVLDTATASIHGTITTNQIDHMPSFGRDVTTLAQLAPGVFGDAGRSAGGGSRNLPGTNQGAGGSTDGIFKTENGPQVVANGSQTNTNNVTIDGISVSSVTWGGTTVVTPNADSVQSVKVTSNDYDAEVGRFSGAQIEITSKSGSNDYHGSFFFKAERPGLNAYQRWNGQNAVQRDTSRFNDFGGSVSGPAWKDKLFPFFAYETLRNDTVNYGSGWYETDSFLGSAPSGSNAAQYLGFPGEGVSALSTLGGTCSLLGLAEGQYCRTISGQGVDVGSPLTTSLGTHDPTWGGSSATPGIGSGLDGIPDIALFDTRNPTKRTASQYYGRMDAQITNNDRASFMIYWVPLESQFYNGPTRAANLWNHSQINDAFTGLWTHAFSPTLINEARANAGGWRWNEIESNPQLAFGLAQANFGAIGNVYPSQNLNFLGAPSGSVFNQWTYGYQDTLTKSLGRHSLKMGGSLTRMYYLNEAIWNARPNYLFAGLWDFLNDAPYSQNGTFNPSTGYPTANRQDNRENIWAFFVQDDWKVTPTLTLNLGLRYSYFAPYYDKGDNLKIVSLGEGSSMITGLSVQSADHEWEAQKGNFGPQFGFAWNPNHYNKQVVIRGGFGINYNQNEMAITAQSINNPGNTVNVTFCCSTASGNTGSASNILYELPSDLNNFYGFPANPGAVTSFGTNGLPSNTATTVSVTGFDPKVKTIMNYHYSLGTEYNIGRDWVASLGYQGSTSRHLFLQQDMKVLAVANGYPLSPQITRVGYYGNKGNANYNAMLASIRHNFTRGYQFEAQYTWSKSLDNGSQPYYQDMYPYNLIYSWGRSDYNVQNAFKIFGMYQPTFFHSNPWMHGFLDGWTLSGIFNLHTGFPWTPVYPGVGNIYYGGSGQSTLRPAAYLGGARNDFSNDAFMAAPGTAGSNFPNGGASYFTEPTFTAVTGDTATAGPLPQAPGVSRNSFNGPRYNDVDLSLAKGFHLPQTKVLGESAMFEFRVNAFNLFNKINLNNPETNIMSTTFGQSQTALGGRVVDLQARFSF